ncbi:MAG: ABC transporter substrate-binding protein [Pseudomonadota bacterium]
MRFAAAIVLGGALAAPVAGLADELVVHFASPWQIALHQPIADAYMAHNPDVTVTLRPPSQNYEDGAQTIVRQSIAGQLPDVTFAGLSRVRTLAERDIPVPLDGYLGSLEAAVDMGYEPAILDIGRVDDNLYAIPFAISTPVAFFNRSLVEQAGGDPDALPDNWDDILELAANIDALGDDIDGMWHRIGPDDWMAQTLIYSTGSPIMTPDESDIAFDNEAGLYAARMVERFREEGGRRPIPEDAARQQFVAGQLGMFFGTTNLVKRFEEQIGDRFTFGTAPYPLEDRAAGGVPVGGNAAVMLTRDPDQQPLAWDYIQFATGPQGQEIVVLNSGYMAANRLALDPQFLGAFYDENPNWRTSVTQLPIARPWFAWPGDNGVRITQTLGSGFERIAQGEPADATFADTVAEIRSMLP